MLLSDVLIRKGQTANPKNNMSMGYTATQMQAICQSAQSEMTAKQIQNSVSFACDFLNKQGFPYYKPSNIL
jgi:hypothetical protein